ncbi:MAG TPA: EF-hand domain-containing protein [Polyangiaceae bacterium]
MGIDSLETPDSGIATARERALLRRGSLTAVVATLRANKVDTDKDGVIDVDELAAGSDPSNAQPGAQLCGPLYGCAGGHIAKVAPRRADRAPWVLASALALLLHARMRRTRAAR